LSPSLSWEEFLRNCEALAKLVRHDNFEPDVLVAVARGGLVPARILSDLLDVREIASLGLRYKDQSYTELVAYSVPSMFGVGSQALLIEDGLESGRSLIVAQELLEAQGLQSKTAALYCSSKAITKPNYFLEVVEEIPSMPWEINARV